VPLFDKWTIRWKLLAVALALVLIPLIFVGVITAYVAREQAELGVTRASRADLTHMSEFTLDLLASHHRQFEVYKEDKRRTAIKDLSSLAEFAYKLVATQHAQHTQGLVTLGAAKAQARAAMKAVNIGETGYVYAMTGAGDLTVHVALEGKNIQGARDPDGRAFIREMCQTAKASKRGEIHTIVYPWKNELLGEERLRKKVVAYLYFEPWDWIVAAGGYLEETYGDVSFERRAFGELVETIGEKAVGETGYIYAMTHEGVLTVHPFRVGESVWDERDHNGEPFIREMCRKKRGWIRYPWKNETDTTSRMKLVHYEHFEPWDWIVAVGSYEEEFYRPASAIGRRILTGVGALTLIVALIAIVLAFLISKLLTDPVRRLSRAMQDVRCGRLATRVEVRSQDELGELARGFNRMADVLCEHKELEANLARQEKMAALGVLASEVAHEINNPLGVILGYASHLEGKLDEGDARLTYAQEIKGETRRCRDIVQDLLGYARVPKPATTPTDLNALIEETLRFVANHAELATLPVEPDLASGLPEIPADPDQLRRVFVNLIANAGAAMGEGERLRVVTRGRGPHQVDVMFADDGAGIPPEELERVFEPFFSKSRQGTGLGLAIVKTIIEQHGGRVRIDSKLGHGTTVTVSLFTEKGASA
jgi:two-component system, NtrC family, sensor kinase